MIINNILSLELIILLKRMIYRVKWIKLIIIILFKNVKKSFLKRMYTKLNIINRCKVKEDFSFVLMMMILFLGVLETVLIFIRIIVMLFMKFISVLMKSKIHWVWRWIAHRMMKLITSLKVRNYPIGLSKIK